jgi:hypothetical protein
MPSRMSALDKCYQLHKQFLIANSYSAWTRPLPHFQTQWKMLHFISLYYFCFVVSCRVTFTYICFPYDIITCGAECTFCGYLYIFTKLSYASYVREEFRVTRNIRFFMLQPVLQILLPQSQYRCLVHQFSLHVTGKITEYVHGISQQHKIKHVHLWGTNTCCK